MNLKIALLPHFNELFSLTSAASVLSILFLTASFSVQAQEAAIQHIDLNVFCAQSPSDAICQNDSVSAQPQNFIAQQANEKLEQPSQIIRLRLNVSGQRDEWIRVETRNLDADEISLTAYHTKRVRQTFLSDAASGLLSFGLERLVGEVIEGYDGPVPSPRINFHRWADHQTRRIVFVPNGCASAPLLLPVTLPNCSIVGADSVTLPAGTDISSGAFVLEYQEQELIRAIVFQVPAEVIR